MKNIRHTLLILALLGAPAAHGAPWQPTDAESDAFVEAYAFTNLNALTDEALALKVQSGGMSSELAACVRDKVQWSKVLPPLRPIVAKTFSSRQNLEQATAFFNSPTGGKIKEIGAQILRNALRTKFPGERKPVPPSVQTTKEDEAAAGNFFESPAGKDFNRFVAEGQPHMAKMDLLTPATEECVHAKAR